MQPSRQPYPCVPFRVKNYHISSDLSSHFKPQTSSAPLSSRVSSAGNKALTSQTQNNPDPCPKTKRQLQKDISDKERTIQQLQVALAHEKKRSSSLSNRVIRLETALSQQNNIIQPLKESLQQAKTTHTSLIATLTYLFKQSQKDQKQIETMSNLLREMREYFAESEKSSGQ
jgi:chromosome segregation ATPase